MQSIASGRIIIILLACGLLLAPVGSASRPLPAQQDSERGLQHEVSVILKLIQVYVMDKSGNPVRDLTKDDFVVTDNGQSVIVTDFERHDILRSTPGGSTQPGEDQIAGVVEVAPALPASASLAKAETIARRFIIFFDFAWNTQRGIIAGKKAALDFLDDWVRPDDETALMSYSVLKGLRVHESLTKDHAKVRKAIVGFSSKEISGRAEEVELEYWLLAKASDGGGDAQKADRYLRDQIEPQRRNSTYQAREYFLALTHLAQAFRLVQGQKHMLFFSNGVPSSLINATRVLNGRIDGSPGSDISSGSTFEIGNSMLRPLQKSMLEEFNASNCSFYVFDTRESAKLPSLFVGDDIQMRTGITVDRDLFRDDRTTGMDSLRTLSKQTGGKYFANIFLHDKGFEEVAAATGTYYVLGYSIPTATDGKFHNLRVEVKRKGCQVRTQAGYFNPKPFREYTNLERDLHLFDLVLKEQAETSVPKDILVSALGFNAGQGMRVQVLSRIPGTIWSGFRGRSAELVAVFFDAQGEIISLQRAAIVPADLSGQDILFTAIAAVGTGPVTCRLILRDLETGRSTVTSVKTFAVVEGQMLTLYSPLVLKPGGGLHFFEGRVKAKSGDLAWRDIYVFDGLAFSPVLPGEGVMTDKLRIIQPFRAFNKVRANLVYKAIMVNTMTGASRDVPLRLGENEMRGTLQTQEMEIDFTGIPEGDFRLYIHAAENTSGVVANASVPLTIRR